MRAALKHPQPRTLAFQLKSKTINFVFRIHHNFLYLPAGRFSFIFKLRHCRLKLKSVPAQGHWLKSKLCRIFIPSLKRTPKRHRLDNKRSTPEVPVFSLISQLFVTQGVRKGAISALLYFVNKLLFTGPVLNMLKLLFILLLSTLSCWALLYYCGFNDFVLSSGWWFISNATSSIDLKEVLSNISAAMGRIEEPALRFL